MCYNNLCLIKSTLYNEQYGYYQKGFCFKEHLQPNTLKLLGVEAITVEMKINIALV